MLGLLVQMISAGAYAQDDVFNHKSIFENHQSIMLIIDATTGNIVDANKAAESFYGYSQEELIHLNISDINSLSLIETQHEMEAALKEKRNYFEFKHKLKDGTIRDVEVYSSPANGEIGNETIVFSCTRYYRKKISGKRSKSESNINYAFT